MQLASVPKLLTCSARAKWSVSAFFAKGYVHITNSKQRKHLFSDAARPCQRPAPPFGANVALENRD